MALTVRVEPDPGRPLGHARIVLGGTTTAAAAGGFRIMREGFAKPNLGPAGWDVTRSDLKPVSVEQEGAQVVLVVGPAVVRHMEAGPALLVLPSDGSEAALFWPDDIEYFDGELPTDDPVPQPPAPPPPAAPPSPPPRVSPPPPAPPQPPAPQPTQPEPVSPQPPNRLPLILLGLLLLALAAAAAWWFLVRKAEEPAPQPAQQQAAPQAPPVQQPQRPPAPPAPVWPDGTDGLSLREVAERAPNAEGLHAVALRRQQAGRHDDALVLFEEAAEKGHAPAMTALARLYDPNGFRPGQPFRSPDPRAAARYYRDAMQRGDAGAQAPRAALKAWLEEQAPRNQSAADALKEFWP